MCVCVCRWGLLSVSICVSMCVRCLCGSSANIAFRPGFSCFVLALPKFISVAFKVINLCSVPRCVWVTLISCTVPESALKKQLNVISISCRNTLRALGATQKALHTFMLRHQILAWILAIFSQNPFVFFGTHTHTQSAPFDLISWPTPTPTPKTRHALLHAPPCGRESKNYEFIWHLNKCGFCGDNEKCQAIFFQCIFRTVKHRSRVCRQGYPGGVDI